MLNIVKQTRIRVKKVRCDTAIQRLKFRQFMTAKDERIGIRVPSELKRALLQIAKREGRSLGQICELFLRGGLRHYEAEGANYIYSLLTTPREKTK